MTHNYTITNWFIESVLSQPSYQSWLLQSLPSLDFQCQSFPSRILFGNRNILFVFLFNIISPIFMLLNACDCVNHTFFIQEITLLQYNSGVGNWLTAWCYYYSNLRLPSSWKIWIVFQQKIHSLTHLHIHLQKFFMFPYNK